MSNEQFSGYCPHKWTYLLSPCPECVENMAPELQSTLSELYLLESKRLRFLEEVRRIEDRIDYLRTKPRLR